MLFSNLFSPYLLSPCMTMSWGNAMESNLFSLELLPGVHHRRVPLTAKCCFWAVMEPGVAQTKDTVTA